MYVSEMYELKLKEKTWPEPIFWTGGSDRDAFLKMQIFKPKLETINSVSGEKRHDFF